MLCLIFYIFNFAFLSQCFLYIPDFPSGKDYEWRKEGDLNIVVLYPVHDFGRNPCASMLSPRSVFGTELLSRKLEDINSDQTFLPNISLGVIYHDDCGTNNGGAARLLQIYQNNCSNESEKNQNMMGILGLFSSNQAIAVAGISSQLQIPVLSTFATAEELSNKARFEYFTRLVPPDNFITQAIIHFSEFNNWKYIQLLYSEGIYGENAAKGITKNAKIKGICIANSIRFDESINDIKEKTQQIIRFHKARVIVVFLSPTHLFEIVKALNQTNFYQHFVFLAADSYRFFTGFEKLQENSFVFLYSLGKDPKFVQHIKSLKPSMENHIWMKKLWEQLGNCKFSVNCSNYANLSETGRVDNEIFTYMYKLGDGIDAYAHSLHNLISDLCPQAFTNKNILKVIFFF